MNHIHHLFTTSSITGLVFQLQNISQAVAQEIERKHGQKGTSPKERMIREMAAIPIFGQFGSFLITFCHSME
ncbi:MAG: hypothetical protein A2W66_05570 [Deltaproteobacteria bacterium RIFCSPLOWO2_02_56_12]|nr:MAG: hypothetical protein A2W66_05570 [Deltaproteobacteria bacterium RIFCSPLOWO2_02_56_12]